MMLWLPTTKKELEMRGWDYLDVILFTGDAYVDHPSFGAAVIGRTLESIGLRVAIVPQPNWRDDLRDFRKLGVPRLFFGVTAGNMDSMVNHYTANKRLRSDDAFSANNQSGLRPDYPTIVYTSILKELYPTTPVVIGGIEASLRRVVHYDYWQDALRPSMLEESGADILIYGQGELPICEVASRMKQGETLPTDVPQTVVFTDDVAADSDLTLHSFAACLKDKRKQADNFRTVEEESNRWEGRRIFQQQKHKQIVIHPPFPTLTTEQIDHSFDLPYTRLPHPRYRGKTIPAYEMIKHSVNSHRGCFGGCAFCTISAHQGKFITSRSEKSILAEIEKIASTEDFKGHITDIGGPSANMYAMEGVDKAQCQKCRRASCIFPKVCKNLCYNTAPMLDLYQKAIRIDGVKRITVGSGLRYDLMLHQGDNNEWNQNNRLYITSLIRSHVSGRLKVAPEHASDKVLQLMRKPSFDCFRAFNKVFEQENRAAGLRQQLIPYFISSHPGCAETDMAELAIVTKELNFRLEQIQDFTPTPMTLATEMFYTGINPYTGEKVFSAHTQEQKRAQRNFFFWYDNAYKPIIRKQLEKLHRQDLFTKLYCNMKKK